jgi:hypothetical protein
MFGLYHVLALGIASMVVERLIHYCYLAWKGWQETALKREMVARGYSAQEIVEVLLARNQSIRSPLSSVPPAKPIRQPSYTS